MIDCPDIAMRESLPEFIHGGLDPDAYERVQQHLDECEACTDEVTLMRQVIIVRAMPSIDVAAITAAIPPYQAQRRSPRHWASSAQWRAIAAALVMAIGVSTFAIHHGEASNGTTQTATVNTAANNGVAIVGVSELSDDHLDQLIGELDTMDAMPADDPDSVVPVALDGGL